MKLMHIELVVLIHSIHQFRFLINSFIHFMRFFVWNNDKNNNHFSDGESFQFKISFIRRKKPSVIMQTNLLYQNHVFNPSLFTHVILMTHHPQGGTIFEGDAGYSGNLHQALMTLNVGENDDIDCWHTLLASLPKSNSTE